ncbi:MAG: phosphoribosyl-ATP diphosphatase [Burkholderiales bacterium]|nr:phosphoribosyl-ATP diphosphatase [Burkholderiales bacterium]MDQ3195398.1 phosphoribosyl-ATP diphosphatase [Pseudomonadota bacterium]
MNVPGADAEVLNRLAWTLNARRGADPKLSYTAKLFAAGEDTILRKIAEEAAETLLASKGGDRLHVVREIADLWFHCLVLLAYHNSGPGEVLSELARREGLSGIDEKKARGN